MSYSPISWLRIKQMSIWLGALPSFLFLLIFVGYPLIQVFQFSTWDWSGFGDGKAIGLANYQRLWQDADLKHSLLTTIGFAAITLPAYVILSIFIALNIEGTFLERPVKTLMFLPAIFTVAASSISWYTLFSPDYGVVSTVLGWQWRWGDQALAAILLISAFTLWQHLGYGIMVFSAGLKSIAPEIIEAARVDGANENQIRWYILLPLLRPSIVFLFTIGMLYAVQSYTAVFLLTKGGPFGSTRVLGYYLYETAFERYQVGYGAALTVFVLVITFTLAAIQGWLLKKDS